MVNVLFVCLGNICRSPSAEGVFPSAEGVFRAVVERERLADRIQVDSAGTASYHLGRPPDPRAQAVARRRGIDLSGLRARRIEPNDFRRFDHLLAMDRRNHADLLAICPPGAEHRLSLFLAFAPEAKALDVPDPYLGGSTDFERMLDLIELGARGVSSLTFATRAEMSADTEETMRRVTGSRPIAARPLGGGRVADVRRIDLADGRSIVAKIGGARSRLAFEGFMLGFSAERSRLPVEALRADDALFGAFGMAFFASHRRHRPIRPGFFEARRDFYNLYPLLVHARLFGGPCLGRIECVLDRFGG